MNVSYPPFCAKDMPPAFGRLAQETTKAVVYLLIPSELLYFAVYFYLKRQYKLYHVLNVLGLMTLWLSPVMAPITCAPARCLQNFAIAIGSMKALDVFARRNALPIYTAGKQPPDWHFAIILLTELRYESFTPNHIRVQPALENFSEIVQLSIHVGIFAILQTLPQIYPTVLAFEVLLAIYIMWTSLQMIVRYKSSPALFGPLYMADSLTGFWSETWHNAFASPSTSLAYRPIRNSLSNLGVPVLISRSFGVIGAFTFMAAFHVYALVPILTKESLFRIGMFFILNGVATVAEAALWGTRKSWIKTVLAWAFETCLASWTASGMNIPNGLSKIPWREIC